MVEYTEYSSITVRSPTPSASDKAFKAWRRPRDGTRSSTASPACGSTWPNWRPSTSTRSHASRCSGLASIQRRQAAPSSGVASSAPRRTNQILASRMTDCGSSARAVARRLTRPPGSAAWRAPGIGAPN
ncbi:hypothetical protein G6F61_014129 [Rhizopus arrhizus]|nr:hypothetical protein G6F61_014129 [Rhizopus arrhizus]